MAKKSERLPIDHYTHSGALRVNLPTEQTQPLMGDRHRRPQAHRPKRRRGESPTLRWDRREEPDGYPAHPLYIREKVESGAFVNHLCGTDKPADQMSIFRSFNGLPEKAAYEWYRHLGNWQNRIIHGESARVMASLAQREGMAGQVQMAYFDPPYGIEFKSNFQVTTRRLETKPNREGLPLDPKMIRVYRDTYERGIDSYLDQMREKLVLMRELLHDTGSVFVQIGDENVHRIAVLLDEVFGHENRVTTIPYATSSGSSAKTLPSVANFLLWYAKDKLKVKYRQLYESLNRSEKIQHMSSYAMVELADRSTRRPTDDERRDPDYYLPEGALLYKRVSLDSQGTSTTGRSESYHWRVKGRSIACTKSRQWSVSMDGLDRLADLDRLCDGGGTGLSLAWKWYEDEVPGRRINNVWHRQMYASDKRYVVQTADSVIERCILMATDPGDLVFDPTCGGATTALAAEAWGRRWITCDTAAVAVAIARQRLTTATFDYWTLADSADGVKAEAQILKKLPVHGPEPAAPEGPSTAAGEGDEHSQGGDRSFGRDPALGFVYERVPRVSARMLAYDEPPEFIYLVDRPHKTRGVVRVCSPFTVQSETPHAYLPLPDSAPDQPPAVADTAPAATAQGAFAERVANEMQQCGVTGVRPGEPSIDVLSLESWPGSAGSLVTHKARVVRGAGANASEDDAAVMIAAEDAVVTPAMLSKAAADAAKQIYGTRLLIAAAFSFEPATAELERIGHIDVVRVVINRDLQIDELTPDRKAQAFVMLGQPDVDVIVADDHVTVKLNGFDTFDPSTGNISSGEPRDVDCWMIDTDHDDRSFYARRIHFPGARDDRQVKRLRKRLGRALDELRWNAAFSAESAPFPMPRSGRIAVKIITTAGIEMTLARSV